MSATPPECQDGEDRTAKPSLNSYLSPIIDLICIRARAQPTKEKRESELQDAYRDSTDQTRF